MEKTCVKDAIPLILTAQAVIVIIGTGVSVAAGIPAFYGKRGIEVKTSNGGSVEDQMSAGVMSKLMGDACVAFRYMDLCSSYAARFAQREDHWKTIFMISNLGFYPVADLVKRRPEIRLYDEEMGPGKIIMDIVSADARSISKGDALVVVGTNLDMPGIIQIIQTIGTAIDEIAGHAIYIDLKAPPTFLSKQFSHFVQGDCQEFAMGAIDKLNDGERDKLVECTYIEEMERRRDMRPLWDWM
ncbi:hypothetical protein CVT25_000035 [Psilocybe cyanescens]|uniref:Uncharacterized protein n=1 Tax=Psilocybe cyanescens TaxID=93625 RepID=A0A409VX00_PSICY|nr:hypothetical protein CVT25_000035 [Psilocybe cyanescens]